MVVWVIGVNERGLFQHCTIFFNATSCKFANVRCRYVGVKYLWHLAGISVALLSMRRSNFKAIWTFQHNLVGSRLSDITHHTIRHPVGYGNDHLLFIHYHMYSMIPWMQIIGWLQWQIKRKNIDIVSMRKKQMWPPRFGGVCWNAEVNNTYWNGYAK